MRCNTICTRYFLQWHIYYYRNVNGASEFIGVILYNSLRSLCIVRGLFDIEFFIFALL